jgi:hypothetical protein
MTPPTLKCTFVATNTTHNLLCRLLGEFARLAETHHTLDLLKLALGEEEFKNFQADMLKLMRERTAVQAVKEIIAQSVRRARSARPRDLKEYRRRHSARFD